MLWWASHLVRLSKNKKTYAINLQAKIQTFFIRSVIVIFSIFRTVRRIRGTNGCRVRLTCGSVFRLVVLRKIGLLDVLALLCRLGLTWGSVFLLGVLREFGLLEVSLELCRSGLTCGSVFRLDDLRVFGLMLGTSGARFPFGLTGGLTVRRFFGLTKFSIVVWPLGFNSCSILFPSFGLTGCWMFFPSLGLTGGSGVLRLLGGWEFFRLSGLFCSSMKLSTAS